MPVYLVIEVNVEDPELYTEYAQQVMPLVERYAGRYLVRGSGVFSVSGDWHPDRFVVIQFETIDLVQDFLTSPEYQALIPLRQRASSSRALIVEGFSYDR